MSRSNSPSFVPLLSNQSNNQSTHHSNSQPVSRRTTPPRNSFSQTFNQPIPQPITQIHNALPPLHPRIHTPPPLIQNHSIDLPIKQTNKQSSNHSDDHLNHGSRNRPFLIAIVVIVSLTLISLPVYFIGTYQSINQSISRLMCSSDSGIRVDSALSKMLHYQTIDQSINQYDQFLFPSPDRESINQYIYLTSTVNSQSNFDDQFREWVIGPYLSIKHNLTFVESNHHSNFNRLINWFGFSWGEIFVEELMNEYSRIRSFQRNSNDRLIDQSIIQTKLKTIDVFDAHAVDQLDQSINQELHQWVITRVSIAQAINQQTIESFIKRRQSTSQARRQLVKKQPLLGQYLERLDEWIDDGLIVRSTVDEPSSSSLIGSNDQSIDQSNMINTATLLKTFHIKPLIDQSICFPILRSTLRSKYCAARVRDINQSRGHRSINQLYQIDRLHNHIVVAMEIDNLNLNKQTSVQSIIQTINQLQTLSIKQSWPTLSFHIFTKPSINQSIEMQFLPLFQSIKQSSLLQIHDSVHPLSIVHHLITSDWLINPSNNQFGSVVMILSDAIIFHDSNNQSNDQSINQSNNQPMTCSRHVQYDRTTGDVSINQLINQYNQWSGNGTRQASRLAKFGSLRDCEMIQQWND